jgi:8-oxo-dGTP pyrophosphatase MutT (NUDIX family)
MRLAANVFDVWAFQRRPGGVKFLLLYTAAIKAERYFNGGRFWQIPSGSVNEDESITDAILRVLSIFGLNANKIWAGEHTYMIFNRRFNEMQAIGVYAADVPDSPVTLDPAEHSEYGWYTFEECLELVHYRGLKEGLRSVQEYITDLQDPAKELCLYDGKDL